MVGESKTRRSGKRNGQLLFASILRKRANVKKLLEYYKLMNVKRSSEFINGSCPLPTHEGPDNTPSFGMRDKPGTDWNGWYKCWLCGTGDIFKFIQQMEGGTFGESVEFLKQFSFGGGLFSVGLLDKEFEDLEKDTEEKPERKPETTYIPSMWTDDLLIAQYMITNQDRKFSPKKVGKVISNFSIGMGFYREKKRIIIPICDENGKWISFFAQNPKDNSDKLFPKHAPTGLVLFGLDKFKGRTRKIILVEGIWDMLKVCSWGLPVVSSFSTSLTSKQAELLLDYFDEVYIAYDNDKGGEVGVERAKEFLYPALSLFRVILPEGYDPCDCSQKTFKKALKNASKIDGDEVGTF